MGDTLEYQDCKPKSTRVVPLLELGKVSGVSCENTHTKPGVEAEEQIAAAFNQLDLNHDGRVMIEACQRAGIDFDSFDVDQDGSISLSEYTVGLQLKIARLLVEAHTREGNHLGEHNSYIDIM